MPKRVLVVEDDDSVVELVAYHLRQSGLAVVTAGSVATALAEIERERPDAIVLDIVLPDLPGTELCRRLRSSPATAHLPILFLSARSSEIDRVVAFEIGGDDYVTKPFSPRELALRVGALLRRCDRHALKPPLSEAQHVIGAITVDTARHTVSVDGASVALTPLEFALLTHLVAARGRVQTRDALLERVWGYDAGVETRTVDTHVKRLRAKLGPAGGQIVTIRGVGYRLQAEPVTEPEDGREPESAPGRASR